MNIWSKRIKEERKKINFTLIDVSKYLGVTESTVQRYESGNIKNIPYEHICKLANLFNCSPAYIMGWEDKNNNHLTNKEKNHIEKYRKLSDSNKKDVDDFIDFRLHKENQNQKKKETHPLLKKLQKEIEEDYFDLNIASADGSNEKRNLNKKEAEELQAKLNRTNEEDKDPFEDMQKKLEEGGFSEKDFK